MSMKLSILLTADGKVAKAEVVGVEGAIDKMGKTADTAGKKTKGLTKNTQTLDAAVGQAKREVEQLSAAEVRNAAASQNMANTNRAAAGSIGNLTAQFNDIGVMLAAGQNPLQLAVQQGTQITQVIGPMGAAGAARALGSAFVSMVSPVSLITLGTIAAGAATIQWLTSANEEAVDFDTLLSELRDGIKNYTEAADLAVANTGNLLEKFGTADPIMRQLLQDMVSLEKVEAYRSIEAVSASLDDMFRGFRGQQQNIGSFFGKDSVWQMSPEFISSVELFQSNLNTLSETTDEGERLKSALSLRDILLENTGGIEGMNAEQATFFRSLLSIIREMETLGAKVKQNEEGQNKAVQSAQKLIAELRTEAEMRALIAVYGKDSVEVAQAKARAERDVFVATTNSRQVSEKLKIELIAAYDAANGLASVDMAGNVGLAADEANRFYTNLSAALNLSPEYGARSVKSGINDGEIPPWAQGDLPETDADKAWQRILQGRRNNARKPARPSRTSSGGGGTSAINQERKAIDDLITSLQRQRDIARETDPVQKEMIRNRKVLANATDAERKTVEELIEARIREEAAFENVTERAEFFGDIASTALNQLIKDGESFDDVLKNIAGSLIDAGIQAALFGDGPFGNIFGGSSIIDLILPQKKAGGGMIYGAGGPRDDKVPVLGSSGEFMVNASATAKNRALLEAINSGAPVQRLAAGGAIGGGRFPAAANRNVGPAPTINIDVTGARGNTEIMEAVQEGIRLGLDEYDRFVLPGRVNEISANPRMVG